MSIRLPKLHAVTNDAILDLPDFSERARALTAAGPVAIHVRSRTIGGRRLRRLAAALIEAGATVFVNDRADVAGAAGAAGLHLPADGFSEGDARTIVGEATCLGRSTHGAAAARDAARRGADYVFLGPIWETRSHPDRVPLGVDEIAAAAPARVIAIGGVTPERIPACRGHGAYGVAAIAALWHADDPGSVARRMGLLLDE